MFNKILTQFLRWYFGVQFMMARFCILMMITILHLIINSICLLTRSISYYIASSPQTAYHLLPPWATAFHHVQHNLRDPFINSQVFHGIGQKLVNFFCFTAEEENKDFFHYQFFYSRCQGSWEIAINKV